MFGGKTLRTRFALGVAVGATIAFALWAVSVKAYLARQQNPIASLKTSPFLIEGFDFNPLRSPGNEWRGPNAGEKIDLTRLRMKDGRSLASIIGKRPIMLVSINPACAMCKTARDEMSYLREELASLDIDYYLWASLRKHRKWTFSDTAIRSKWEPKAFCGIQMRGVRRSR